MIAAMALCCGRVLGSVYESGLFALDNVDPFIQMITPVGIDTLYIGSEVLFSGNIMDYNLNGLHSSLRLSLQGALATLLEEQQGSGIYYVWAVPDTETDQASLWLSAEDRFGNQSQISIASHFSIVYDRPLAPNQVRIQLINGLINLNWQAVTSTIRGYPCDVSSYLVQRSTTAIDGSQSAYQTIGITGDTTFCDLNGNPAQRAWYRVIALKTPNVQRINNPVPIAGIETNR